MFGYQLLIVAATTAKSLQSCPTLCDPIDGSPPGSAVPGILQARTLEWVAISFSSTWKSKVKVKSLNCNLPLLPSLTCFWRMVQFSTWNHVCHIYNGILLSHKKEQIRSPVEMWVEIESVIQCGINQKEKNKYHTLINTCGI